MEYSQKLYRDDLDNTPDAEFLVGEDEKPYKAHIIIGNANGYNITVGVNQRFNWFQRLMIKWCFGFKVFNVKKKHD